MISIDFMINLIGCIVTLGIGHWLGYNAIPDALFWLSDKISTKGGAR